MAEPVPVSEKIALLNLLSVDGIGSGTAVRLVNQFESACAVFDAPEARLSAVPRMAAAAISKLKAVRADGDVGKRQYEKAVESGVEVRTFWDDAYPPLLRQIEHDAPAVLFIRGNLPTEARRLAIVGTRGATVYGKRMTHDLVVGLGGSGVHIVSGLASGIDGFAHEASLEAGLMTEAVFGCGVDHIYPPFHETLSNRIIAAGGALLSEYPLGTTPDRFHFPQRNRIISGLSQVTLVIEAGEKSGALITALLALDYNREVAAVPGAVTNPKSAGCHELIKNGAALIERVDDILQLLEVKTADGQPDKSRQPELVLDGPEANVIKLLDASEAQHIDLIAERLGLPVGETLGQLLLLELKGAVKQLPGKYFVRA
ncbi:MAG TPA: DNA-processing protein DprA [bacterium]|jgi:DNA processing protein